MKSIFLTNRDILKKVGERFIQAQDDFMLYRIDKRKKQALDWGEKKLKEIEERKNMFKFYQDRQK